MKKREIIVQVDRKGVQWPETTREGMVTMVWGGVSPPHWVWVR